MTLTVRTVDCHIVTMRARMPFRYGIAALTALPHLFLRAEVMIDGRPMRGLAADGLPPKWFTKDPFTTFRDDLGAMLRLIEHAAALAQTIGEAPTPFALWQQLHAAQGEWATREGYPPLLWGFGVSLVERAIIDAYCHAIGAPFARAVRANSLGIDLGAIHPELGDASPAALLPAHPRRTIIARHTVGLGDPLTDEAIPADERIDDGLPRSLVAAIATYGLTRFKIKLAGDIEHDLLRLRQIAAILDALVPDYRYTLDGNEQFSTIGAFHEFWDALRADRALALFLHQLLFIEQPLRRDVALDAAARDELAAWIDRPPLIIDESDDTLDALPLALGAGYAGTSHKNCKGIFKGVANACLLTARQRADPGRSYLLSAEDLANVGPVALLQDLAVVATLGIEHAERNGHHYFAGLRHLPDDLQRDILAAHGDLYRRHEPGFAALDLRGGRLATGSVVDAPFGYAFDFDPSRFTPLDEWDPAALGVAAQ